MIHARSSAKTNINLTVKIEYAIRMCQKIRVKYALVESPAFVSIQQQQKKLN